MTKLDPSKEAIIFDCYIDRKVTLWMRDKYRIVTHSKEAAINRLKQLAKEPDYDTESEFIECETLFDTEEPCVELLGNKEHNPTTLIIHDPTTNTKEEIEP